MKPKDPPDSMGIEGGVSRSEEQEKKDTSNLRKYKEFKFK